MMHLMERYDRDPIFHSMVDTLVCSIERGLITPTEAREAAMLAQLIFENRHPRLLEFTAAQLRSERHKW